ncbi:hypothetical protein ES705_26695 [subsurface metagenome]
MREAYKPCMECGRFILPELFAMHQRWHVVDRRRREREMARETTQEPADSSRKSRAARA